MGERSQEEGGDTTVLDNLYAILCLAAMIGLVVFDFLQAETHQAHSTAKGQKEPTTHDS